MTSVAGSGADADDTLMTTSDSCAKAGPVKPPVSPEEPAPKNAALRSGDINQL